MYMFYLSKKEIANDPIINMPHMMSWRWVPVIVILDDASLVSQGRCIPVRTIPKGGRSSMTIWWDKVGTTEARGQAFLLRTMC